MKKVPAIFSMLLAVAASVNAYAQCTDHVTHTSGTTTVAGVAVTVSSNGGTDSNSVYCASTVPYFIGYNYSTGLSTTGSYTFIFSPPVSALTLNFSGLSSDITNEEIVVLTVNNAHYVVTSPGSPNNCDPMAVVTPSGDIGPCNSCGVSGWNGTTIQGPITSLTVTDSVVAGSPAGSIFSLFICGDSQTGIANGSVSSGPLNVYPNPAAEQIVIAGTRPGTSYSIADASGRIVLTGITGSGAVNISSLAAGLYAVILPEGAVLRFVKQ